MTAHYEVVSPIGDARDAGERRRHRAAPPLADPANKRIGLIWTAFSNGDIVLHAFRDHLARRYPEMQFVEIAPGRGLRWGDHPDPSIAALASEQRLDGAIVSAGC